MHATGLLLYPHIYVRIWGTRDLVLPLEMVKAVLNTIGGDRAVKLLVLIHQINMDLSAAVTQEHDKHCRS